MKKILFILFFVSLVPHVISHESSLHFHKKYLTKKKVIIRRSLGINAPEYIIKIDSIYEDGILCKVYKVVLTGDPRLPDTHTSFAEYIFVTNISQKNLIDGQELPTNVIVCRHRYYVKAKNFTFPYRCNQCRCGIISPKMPTDVLRGWKLYRIGAQNVDGRTIAKFSMKNPEKAENNAKSEKK